MKSPIEQFAILTAKQREQYGKVVSLRAKLQQEEASLNLLTEEIQIISDRFRQSSEQLVSQDKKQTILRLLQQGYKQKEIAEITEVDPSYITRVKQQYPDLFKKEPKTGRRRTKQMGDSDKNFS
ncbi:MAG: hypothetical protein JEZ07_06350 [Phycisphaerae bacterium]|nr:hypothetical protein [Phycisphaerae bacterium]